MNPTSSSGSAGPSRGVDHGGNRARIERDDARAIRQILDTDPPSHSALQLSLPVPRWAQSTASRLKANDIWGLGLSSDLPVDESIFSANVPKPESLARQGSVRKIGTGPIKLGPDGVNSHDGGLSIGSTSARAHPLQRASPPTSETTSSYFGSGFFAGTATSADGSNRDVLGDVSRPSLRRLTSDMERKAGSLEGLSRRGSGSGSNGLNKGKGKAKAEVEVEVLVHQVAPNETVAGIALIYGIDLATLRKVNKLWPSDPPHLRAHLYVPLDACRWDRAKGGVSLVRGPGEGQVTLVEKGASIQGHAEGSVGRPMGEDGDWLVDISDTPDATTASPREVESESGTPGSRFHLPEPSPVQWTGWALEESSRSLETNPEFDPPLASAGVSDISIDDPWVSAPSAKTPKSAGPPTSLPRALSTSSPQASTSASRQPTTPLDEGNKTTSRVARVPKARTIDVVRIPASQLSFFPAKSASNGTATSSSRTSLDSSGFSAGRSRSQSQSRSSLHMSRASLGSIPGPNQGSQGPSISNDMRYSHDLDADRDKHSELLADPLGKPSSKMVRLRPPTSGEKPPTTYLNRLSNLFAIPPPPPGVIGVPTSSGAASKKQNLARVSLDSSRSAISGRSGRSGGSAASLSRSGSWRGLSAGLADLEVGEVAESGADSNGSRRATKGGIKADEVEMVRRGSEETLRPNHAASALPPHASPKLGFNLQKHGSLSRAGSGKKSRKQD